MRVKIASEDLKELILMKFGSLDNFAKKAGLNNSQVSVGLKQQTARFMALVKKLGIRVDSIDDGKKKDSFEEIRNQLKNTQDRLASLETILKEKEQVIEHQNNMLKMMTQFVEEMKKKNK